MEEKDKDIGIKILTGDYVSLGKMLEEYGFNSIELDLGCGKGSFSTRLAAEFPDRLILAADVMIGRLRKLHKRNSREKITNIVPLRVEARTLLGVMLPDKSLRRLHILCPDPWPKDKHRANRLLCSDFMAQIHRVLEDDGIFHFSSDDDNYWDIVESLARLSGLFDREDAAIANLRDIKSDFEARWLEQGKKVQHFAWRKLPLPPKAGAGH